MPYEIRQLSPRKFEVINPVSGEIHAKHTSLKNAKAQVRLLLSVMKKGGRKRGGMMGWVSSILGRHPQLTREQREKAERFADELMADPTGVSFEGAITIPPDVRKELAEEAYNRLMMGREDRPVVGDASEVFADEIRKQLEAQKKKGKGIGGRRRGYSIHNFVGDLNKANPVMWGIKNHPSVGIKLGQVTNDNLLPAVVAVGKPVYDATAIALATTYTGNPLLGKAVADEFWNEFGRPYDPRNRQDNEALKRLSEKAGDIAGKKAKQVGGARKRTRQELIDATQATLDELEQLSIQLEAQIELQEDIMRGQEDGNPDQDEGDEGHAFEGINHELLDDLIQDFNDLQERIEELEEELEDLVGQQEQGEAEGETDDSSESGGSLVHPVNFRSTGLDWYGGASALQKGEACEVRGYLNPSSGIYRQLNQIIHSGDPPIGKYGTSPNPFRDLTNSKDPNAEKSLQYAYKKLREQQRPTQSAKSGKGYVTPALGKPLPFF